MMFAIQMLTHVSKNVASFGISEAERWSYVMGWYIMGKLVQANIQGFVSFLRCI